MDAPLTDKERAERAVLDKPLSAKEQKAVAFAEPFFNEGFDAAIKATTPRDVLRYIKFDHPRYIADRHEQFLAAVKRWRLREHAKES